MKRERKKIRGSKTFKELYLALRISKDTLRRRMIPLRPFLNHTEKGMKRIYSAEEVDFILKNIRL